MRKLTRSHLEKHNSLCQAIYQARDRLNAARLADDEDVEEASEELLNAFQEARDWLDSIADEQQTYFDSRSEKWQESERGEDYQEWMESFRSDQLDEPDIEPGKPVVVDLTLLEDLPDRPD
jgi:oligoendopeptidase F